MDDEAVTLARQVVERISAGSMLARRLGIRAVEVGPGRAVLEMTVTPEHANWHGTCHGGAIASLADTAFGYACQSTGDAMVAAGFDLVFVAPAQVGQRLVAVAQERIRYGRSGLVDVTVFAGDPEQGRVVAELRGRSRSLGRRVLDGDAPAPQGGELRLTRSLPEQPDAVAPDGSQVRLLALGRQGSMAHFRLEPAQVSAAVRHRTVEELWYVVEGTGRMWRRYPDGAEEVADLVPGVSLLIPVGTAFQFRNDGDGPFSAVGTTMPPWPGDDEAEPADGPWS